MSLAIKTVAELQELADEQQKYFDSIVSFDEDYIGFPERSYWIEKDRINSYQKIVWWLSHLSGKRWYDQDHNYAFLQKLGKFTGVEMRGSL